MGEAHRRAETADRPSLIERASEIAAIQDALEVVRRRDGCVVVAEGEPGIGKSTLLAAATTEARDRSFRVLTARASELEQDYPFGVATALLTPAVRGRVDLFAGPASAARAVLSPSTPSEGAPPDPHASLHALYWLTLDLAASGPLCIAVDDAQWADEASLRYLTYLAQRPEGLSVLILLAMRPSPAENPLLDQLRLHPAARRLRLQRLTEEGVGKLLDRSSITGTDDRRSRIWHATGGNPFYVVELVRSGIDPGLAAGTTSVPDTVHASIRRRIAVAGTGAPEVAEAVAILGDEATFERASDLTGVAPTGVAVAARRLVEHAILDSEALAFIHPIVRSAVYEGIPPVVRRAMHASASRILDRGHAPALAVGTQLLQVEPTGDAFAVEALHRAARTALAQGDPAAAAVFLTRALDEPPGADRGRVLLDLARAEAGAGTTGAADRFEDAIGALDDPHDRAQARLAQGHALIATARWRDAASVFAAGLDDVDARATELKSQLEAGFVSSSFVGLVDHHEAEQRLQHILAKPLTDPAHRELAAWTSFQQTIQVKGTAQEVARLARRALDGAVMDDLVRGGQVVELVAGALLGTGDLDEEIVLLDEAIESAERLGAFAKLGVYAYCRSLPNLLSGRIAESIADAQAAIAAHEHGWDTFYPGSCAALAWGLLERGDVDGASRALTIDDEQWSGRLDFQFMVPIARSRVRLALNDPAGALAHTEAARRMGAMLDIRTPSILADWAPWHAIALRQLNRRDEALATADEALELARRWSSPAATARALWCLGLTEGRDGLEHLREAVDLVRPTPSRLLRARIEIDLGAGLRRAGQLTESREWLRRGAELAHEIGALALLDQARSELAAAGARPRRFAVSGVDALTPSELRVARMAGGGRTNREIAQSLFVTPKAIEYHLANAYRKLSISGRRELAGALGQAAGSASV